MVYLTKKNWLRWLGNEKERKKKDKALRLDGQKMAKEKLNPRGLSKNH